MNLEITKKITLSLLDTFKEAGNLAIQLRKKGLKKEIKVDNTPVTNGDIEVNNIFNIFYVLDCIARLNNKAND